MANEPIQGLPYPDLTGVPPNVPADIKALADAIAPRSVMRFASIAARDAALPTPVDGMVCFVAADNGYYARVGGQWVVFWSDTGWVDVIPEGDWSVTARVRRIGRMVTLEGFATGTIAANTTVTVGTIPVGFRPALVAGMPVSWNTGEIGFGRVMTDGAIQVRKPTAGAATVYVTQTWAL